MRSSTAQSGPSRRFRCGQRIERLAKPSGVVEDVGALDRQPAAIGVGHRTGLVVQRLECLVDMSALGQHHRRPETHPEGHRVVAAVDG